MPEQSSEATSPAATGDAKAAGSGNLTQGQAAARLFASASAAAAAPPAETATPKPPDTVTVETTPEKSEETTAAPVTEAPAASVEPEAQDEEGAAEQAAAAEPEAEEDSVPSQSTSQLSPELQEILNRRIAKEVKKTTAMREAMEAKVADLEAKLSAKVETPAVEAKPSEPAAPAISNSAQPLVQYNDLASLGTLQTQAKAAVRWAEETLDTPKSWKTRVDVDPDTGEEITVRTTTNGDQTYTEAQVKGIMRTAKVTLEDQIPARAQFITARQRAQQVAREEFPFLTDKKSPEYQQAQQMLRDPWVQMRHDAEWVVGTHIRGMKAIEADKAAKKAAETKPKPKAPAVKPSSDQSVVSATGTTGRTPPATANRQAMAAEQQKMKQKGGITTAEAIASLQNRERIRNSR